MRPTRKTISRIVSRWSRVVARTRMRTRITLGDLISDKRSVGGHSQKDTKQCLLIGWFSFQA